MSDQRAEPGPPPYLLPRAWLWLSPRRWLRLNSLVVLLVLCLLVIAAHSWLMLHLMWRRSLALQGFVDEMPAPTSSDRLLVVAPHPDDEVLGCGGLIRQALDAGAQVTVALMTNGDASELSLIFGERELSFSPKAYEELGVRRQQETLKALSLLGLPADHVHFLGYPNNGLLALWQPGHWRPSDAYRSPYTHASSCPYRDCYTPQAPYCGQQVLADLISLLQRVRPTEIFTTASCDIHPDHCATNFFVRYALATIAARGSQWAREARLYTFLIHWPYYPAPRGYAPKVGLLPPPQLSGDDTGWLRLPLTASQTALKARAIRCYRSQEPTWDRLLYSFARANEAFRSAPVTQVLAGEPARWLDEDPYRRNLGGADLASLSFLCAPHTDEVASVAALHRAIPVGGYIAVDLRTWDSHGLPIITTAYLRRGRALQVVRIAGGAPMREVLATLVTSPAGKYVIRGDLLPPERLRPIDAGSGASASGASGAAGEDALLTCWGSVRDRRVDPMVATMLHITGLGPRPASPARPPAAEDKASRRPAGHTAAGLASRPRRRTAAPA